MADSYKVISTARRAIEVFLAQVGLNLKQAKTRMVFTGDRSVSPDGNNSFIFLGMLFRQFRVKSKYKATKIGPTTVQIGLHIYPNQRSVDRHFQQVRETLRSCTTPAEVVERLNPIIRG